MKNLADDPARKALKEAMREQLFRELKEQEDPRMAGKGSVFDEYLHSEEATRGFYEKYKSGKTPKAGWVSPSDFEKEPLD
jgi:N-sulfoglucosamine sulfohydrolase